MKNGGLFEEQAVIKACFVTSGGFGTNFRFRRIFFRRKSFRDLLDTGIITPCHRPHFSQAMKTKGMQKYAGNQQKSEKKHGRHERIYVVPGIRTPFKPFAAGETAFYSLISNI